MLRVNSRTPSSSCPSTPSPLTNLTTVPENGLPDDMLNMSPRPSYHSGSIVHLERILHDQLSLHWVVDKASGCSSTTPIPSIGAPMSKSAAELIKEIATLEVEVMHLERYLLSLYRTAFQNQLSTLPSLVMEQGSRSYLQNTAGSSLQDVTTPSFVHEDIDIPRSGRIQHNLTSSLQGSAGSDHSYHLRPRETSKKDLEKTDSGLHSLADHLGSSLNDHVPETPDKLSEDIIRCISSIYCKLVNPPLPFMGVSDSPTSSLSSSNTFSPQDLHDNWSPMCSEEATVNPYQPNGMKEKNGPYAEMIEVQKICLDDDKFNYAASVLKIFRSLVQRLDKVNPRKMKREEKLVFWINIHNALVMHAYLAYGIHRNRMRNTSLILKAAYKVGGHSINAFLIQSSILGCCQRHSASWLQKFLSPGSKLQSGSAKHTYALDYPEPLVHFALCSGAYSDPAVRVYTAKSVFQELNLAKDEFIQASVSIYKGAKVILPKILYYFAKDASLNLSDLLEIVHACLSEDQQNSIQRCLKGRPEKYIEWSPYNSAFGYVIDKELAKCRKLI